MADPAPLPRLEVLGIPGLPMVVPGEDLATLLLTALSEHQLTLADGDVICVAQKIVSKAEGRLVALDTVTPGPAARALATEVEKDPRLVELILSETDEVLRKRPGILIVRHRLGFVLANAGVDQSNVDHSGGEMALLLPVDPDASARSLRTALQARLSVDVGVIVTDSANRPWRLGTTGMAIGAAGVHVLDDRRGGTDSYGRELKVTMVNVADSVAAAATLIMGETTEKLPVAIVRGLGLATAEPREEAGASVITRPLAEDLFR